MGFPMLMTAMWLFWLAGKHFEDRVIWLGFFLVMVAAATWVFGQFVQRGRTRRGLALACCVALLGIAYGWGLESELSWRSPAAVSTGRDSASSGHPGGIQWKTWSPEAVAEARAQGRPVLVDFTADWCAICNVNRRTSLEIPSVMAKLQELGVVTLLGDYTTTPDNITAELEKWQRGGVPLVIVYPKDASLPGKALPEALTPGIVLDALREAGK
jgi:thiol:disulfide interchange protein DsbD